MFSVEVSGIELRKFISYMAELYDSQPDKGIHKFIVMYNKQAKRKCLIYPGYGTFQWQHKDDVFSIEFKEEGTCKRGLEGIEYFIRLHILHQDLDKIQGFMHDVFSYTSELDDDNKIKLFISKCGQYHCSWDRFNSVNVQSLENIFIDKQLKQNIVDYIDNFILSKEKYDKFGRNYKTTLLLTGIPGSGKTSLCKALARKYGYSIYIMNFNKNMTDDHLIELTSEVKDKSIILYEDIDIYFSERTPTDVNVSFGCLINVLDGTLSNGSGIINIITTNIPDKLDIALLRPGRIDKIINFTYPKKDEIREAFNCLIGSTDDFDKFYNNIKGVQMSMSAIIEYLFRYPDTYLDNISELISQMTFINKCTKEDSRSKLYT